MKRGTIFILLFLIIAAGIVGASTFFRSQPPLVVRVAVHPLAGGWVRDAAVRFNATSPTVNSTQRIQIAIETIDDLQVWNETQSRWTVNDHPDAWIPALSDSIDYAVDARVPFERVAASLASTPLVWGGFASAIEMVTPGAPYSLDWDALQANIAAPGAIKLALPHPTRSIEGLAVVFSAAAAYADSADIEGATVTPEFRAWLTPLLQAVPNFNTLGNSVAQTLAARGPSVGAVTLLSEAEWLRNLSGQLTRSDPIQLNYPAYTVLFDFPMARWAGTSVPNSPQATNAAAVDAGVRAFAAFLARADEQTPLMAAGLRPVNGAAIDGNTAAFTPALAYGVLAAPDLSRQVQLPPRSELLRLIQSLNTIVR